ncbi:MAG: Tn3 family transposase [Alphaproteobacteria bacterium]|nr:Tn3 family transposase [Alphaproteobacteria bacterium]
MEGEVEALEFGLSPIKVMSATNHEAPYVLDGLLHHGTLLKIDTHYRPTLRR